MTRDRLIAVHHGNQTGGKYDQTRPSHDENFPSSVKYVIDKYTSPRRLNRPKPNIDLVCFYGYEMRHVHIEMQCMPKYALYRDTKLQDDIL